MMPPVGHRFDLTSTPVQDSDMDHSDVAVLSNGHATAPLPKGQRTTKPKTEAALPTVQFRPDTKKRFAAAAEACGLGLTDAADLATALLEDVAADEKVETIEERKARLRGKRAGK